MDEATDWSGQVLPRQMTRHLFPGCIVRIAVSNDTSRSEVIYFEIVKIKDGTFWGIAQDTYRITDWIGLADGAQMSFRKEHINEIPLSWQPKRYQKAIEYLRPQMKQSGYFPTGLRGL